MTGESIIHNRRNVLKWGTTMIAASGLGLGTAAGAEPVQNPGLMHRSAAAAGKQGVRDLRRGVIGYMLATEQFPAPELARVGAYASRRGFHLLASSDHLQPWQPDEGHATQAWINLGAVGANTRTWMGTTVTCPTMRYNPAVVAEAFATLSELYPGRIFLGVGSGEALNEEAATGTWPKWPERWDRLIEAIAIIRALWGGQEVNFKGKYYTVDARLYSKPAQPIPLLTAANGKKSMRLAGQYGDGLITDPETWKKHKQEWVQGAHAAGKDPAEMPVLVEQYAVVGDKAAAQKPAELWRFGPKAFKTYYDIPSPARIEQLADQQVPISKVLSSWVVSPDPQAHISKIGELFDSGVSIVNVHAPQADQQRVIDFYAENVLPHFRQAPVTVRSFAERR